MNPIKICFGCAAWLGLGLLVGVAQAEPAAGLRWERLPSMPVGVFDAAISVRGRQAVITGGITQTGQTTNQVQVFDLQKLSWTTPVRLKSGVCQHAQVTLGDGRVFVFGGVTGQLPEKLEPADLGYVIDLDAGKVTDVPGVGDCLEAPSGHLLPDGRAIVIGGKAAYLFDPASDRWQGAIPLRMWRKSHASLLLDDGRVLVAGGLRCDTLEVVDVARGASQLLTAKLPMPLDDLRLVRLSTDRVMILGGQTSLNGDTTDRSWVLDLSGTESRIEEGPATGIPGGVADHCATQIGPWVIILGGETQKSNKDTELDVGRMIHSRSGWVWSTPRMSQPHDDSVSVTVGRQVILFGGYRVKAMTLPCLSVGEKERPRSVGFPSIGLPIAAGIVERLTLPEDIEPMVMINVREEGAQASVSPDTLPSLSTPRIH